MIRSLRSRLVFSIAGFVMLFFQGISEIIKKIAVMRGIIEDPNPFVSAHEAAAMEGEIMVREMTAAIEDETKDGESRK